MSGSVRTMVPSEPKTAAQFLMQVAPFSVKPERAGFNTSGLDCLVVLIRRIYCCRIREQTWNKADFVALEAQNPILQYAWKHFQHQNPDENAKKACAREKRQLLKSLREGGDVFDSSFDTLATSTVMNKALWGTIEFVPFRETSRWGPGQDDFLIENLTERERIAKESLLIWDCTSTDSESLQDFINRQFWYEHGPRELQAGCWRTETRARYSLLPTFVCIRYTPGSDSPRSRRELMEFVMPCDLPHPPTRADDDHFFRMRSDTRHYSLAAAVRLRGDAKECDRVMAFRGDGRKDAFRRMMENISLEDFDVETASHSYMLLYAIDSHGRPRGDPPFPRPSGAG